VACFHSHTTFCIDIYGNACYFFMIIILKKNKLTKFYRIIVSYNFNFSFVKFVVILVIMRVF